MIMSKISMNIHHPSVRQAMRDRNDMHRNLSQAIGKDFVYRIVETRNRVEIITISENTPDGEELAKRGYSLDAAQDVSILRDKYRENTVFSFDLLAAPTKKIKDDSKNGKRLFLKTPEERKNWLKQQGEKYGFEVLAVVEAAEKTSFMVGRNSGAFYVTGVRFEGMLKITDASLFWKAWENGIGPEKAYGLGLLTIRK